MKNKLQLLCDILDEHQSHSSGSATEYAQLERIAKSILTNKELSNQEVQDVLSSIQQYGQTGAAVSDLTQHVHDHQDQFDHWISTVQQNL